MDISTNVVIVGGGPTGLLLAAELALAKTNVVVVERRSEPVGQARALSMHPRSLETLALRGIENRFLLAGVKVPTGHYAACDVRLDFTKLDSTFAFGLLIPQTTTEHLLEARALELGVRIERGCKGEGVRQDADGVSVEGSRPDGHFRVRADYLVGADGARSTVRQASGIGFPGEESGMSVYFGDVFIDSAPVTTTGRFQVRNAFGIMEGFPMADGRHRVVFVDAKRVGTPVHTPVVIEEMQDGASRIMGGGVKLRDPSWMSRFGDETKLADHYRKGRVFLAGDAAHIHMPAGGQGMNTGIQDAMNLGWKLAGVLRGEADDSLLDSYQLERRPVGQRLVENTKAQRSLLRNLLQEGDALWNAFNDLLRHPATNLYLSGMITAIDTHYLQPLPGVEPPCNWTGRRLKDLQLRSVNGEQRGLYAMLHAGAWVELRLKTDGRAPRPCGVAESWVVKHDIELGGEADCFAGLSAVLVRPDGHVAATA